MVGVWGTRRSFGHGSHQASAVLRKVSNGQEGQPRVVDGRHAIRAYGRGWKFGVFPVSRVRENLS